MSVIIRNTKHQDFEGIIELSKKVYPGSIPWSEPQLASHLEVFPEGQFVAVDSDSGRIIGMAASLIILWDNYDMSSSWRDFTDRGMFRNHDPVHGRTLYGAEVMVDRESRRGGVGTKIYRARRDLITRLGLLRIRAGARLRGYHRYADQMSAEEYTIRVVQGEFRDPTLTFQLHRGFQVLAVVSNYLRHDPESLGYAAVIEWLNPEVARPEDYAMRNPKFLKYY
jgi:hypothetical protein